MSDFVLILSCSTAGYLVVLIWFWIVRVKKKNTIASSGFHRKVNFSETNNFNYFYDGHGYIKNFIHHINLV